MHKWVVALSAALMLNIVPAFAADGDTEKAPDFYIGPGIEFDLENDETSISFSFAGSGKGTIAPDFGLYDDHLLVGVRYMFLGQRADLRDAFYGGPTVFYYDEHIGGGLILGKHLSRRVILEASYRATSEWDGEADLSAGYGFDWPW